MALVFVYGTLKAGHHNNYLLASSTFKGKHCTAPEYVMVDLGYYPAVVEGGRCPIHGEVWKVSDDTLHILDKLEGYPDYYTRKLVQTTWGEAWMYIMKTKETGEW